MHRKTCPWLLGKRKGRNNTPRVSKFIKIVWSENSASQKQWLSTSWAVNEENWNPLATNGRESSLATVLESTLIPPAECRDRENQIGCHLPRSDRVKERQAIRWKFRCQIRGRAKSWVSVDCDSWWGLVDPVWRLVRSHRTTRVDLWDPLVLNRSRLERLAVEW